MLGALQRVQRNEDNPKDNLQLRVISKFARHEAKGGVGITLRRDDSL